MVNKKSNSSLMLIGALKEPAIIRFKGFEGGEDLRDYIFKVVLSKVSEAFGQSEDDIISGSHKPSMVFPRIAVCEILYHHVGSIILENKIFRVTDIAKRINRTHCGVVFYCCNGKKSDSRHKELMDTNEPKYVPYFTKALNESLISLSTIVSEDGMRTRISILNREIENKIALRDSLVAELNSKIKINGKR